MARDRPGHLELRLATEADRPSLERLAAFDGKRAPDGAALVAVLDGEIVVALPLGGGPAIAGPFRPTAGLMRLLELRALELSAETGTRSRLLLTALCARPA